MKKTLLSISAFFSASLGFGQSNPAITEWIINESGLTGRHYISGSSTFITDTAKANVQMVRYSSSAAYINTSGIPSYIIGPYLDGNPAQGTNRNWLFKIPLSPTEETGTKTSTPLGTIGIFINGVPMYNYSDAMSYNDMDVWHRSAVFFEMAGFDCAKGHPSPVFSGPPPSGSLVGGSYHHHQNPTAFNLDGSVISDVCDLYVADGLYVMNETEHSPLIGFAFDGYPVYGAYGYANPDGTGGIKRIESSYQLRSMTTRTTLADGTVLTVAEYGPNVSTDYPLGCFEEDYEFIDGSGDLDLHNGRFTVTPEYPEGTYAYFATVDANQNSYYPYIIGPTYYGTVENENFFTGMSTQVTISESVTVYNPSTTAIKNSELEKLGFTVFPNPSSEFVAIQAGTLLKQDLSIELYDMNGKRLSTTVLHKGSTIAYLDTRSLYEGEYIVYISDGKQVTSRKLLVKHD